MWIWTCSACGAEFVDLDEAVAEAEFMAHARKAHKPKMLLSMRADTTEGES